jgi:hypothetical protein
MFVGRDLFILDLRIETCGKFILHMRYRKSMGYLHYVTDFHHTVESIGISAVWLGSLSLSFCAAVEVWDSSL